MFATLSKPALTDHAFLTPQGRLQKALAPFARRPGAPVTGTAPGTTHPLVGFLATPQHGTAADGGVHALPTGTRLLACAADPKNGRVQVLATGPTGVRRLDVYADVLAEAFGDGGGLSLLEALVARLGNL